MDISRERKLPLMSRGAPHTGTKLSDTVAQLVKEDHNSESDSLFDGNRISLEMSLRRANDE